MTGQEPDRQSGGPQQAAISNMVVRVTSECTGRGPTRARTYFNDDLVTVVLQDTLTKSERSLVGNGQETLVLDTRDAYQQAMRNALVGGVETITGRSVRAFMSTNHVDPDFAVEVFMLEPVVSAEPGPTASA